MKKKTLQTINDSPNRRFNRKDIWLVSSVIVISLCLNIPGFNWGKDGYVPWSPDAIEGITTVREMPRLFGNWTYKYPRLQFLIDGLCYKPFIGSWESDKLTSQFDKNSGNIVFTQKQLDWLATISRINVQVMSILIILFVYLIAKFYYADSIAAFFASLSLAVTLIFVYYAHTTCVDIPSMFWITLGAYYLLKSVYSAKLSHHIGMAAAFACACCTKDPMLFYAAAFALAYVVLRIHHLRGQGLDFRRCVAALLNKNTWIALGVFLFVFALLQGALFSPKAYWDRMGVWVGGRGVKDFNQGFKGQLNLLTVTLWMFYWAIGWPMLILFFISLAGTFKKHGLFNLVVVILPLVIFYILVSMRIQMSYIRYYLPVMGLLYLPVGAFVSQAFADRTKRLPRLSLVLIGICFLLSLTYCISHDMELMNDTRNRAAGWFRENVKENTSVLSLIRYPFGLKISKYGYPTIDHWKVPPLQTLLANQDKLPEYIVLSSNWLTIATPQAAEFKTALLEGKTNYAKAAEFKTKGFIYPRRNWLAIAAWPKYPRCEEISPEIIIMQKNPAK